MSTVYLIQETVLGIRPKINSVSISNAVYEDREEARREIHRLGESVYASKENDNYKKHHVVLDDMDLVHLVTKRAGRVVREYRWEVIQYELKKAKAAQSKESGKEGETNER